MNDSRKRCVFTLALIALFVLCVPCLSAQADDEVMLKALLKAMRDRDSTRDQDVAIFAQTEGRKVEYAAFSPDGKQIACVYNNPLFNSQSPSGKIIIWDFEEGRLLTAFDYKKTQGKQTGVNWLEYSPDGKYLYVGGYTSGEYTQTGTLYDTSNWDEYLSTNILLGTVYNGCITFSKSGGFMAVLRENQIAIIDLATKKQTKTIPLSANEKRSFITISPDDKYILVTASNPPPKLQVFYLDSGEKYLEIPSADAMGGQAIYSPDGKQFIFGNKLFDAVRFRELRTFPVGFQFYHKYMGGFHRDGSKIEFFTGVTFDKNGNRIAINPITTSGVSISPDGKYTAYGMQNGTILIRETKEYEDVLKITFFEDGEWVCMTSDGYYNASPHGDEHINIRIKDEAYVLNQFSRAFYHPEVITARLQGKKDPDVVKHFGNIMLSVAPPAVMVTLQNEKTAATSGTAELNIKVVDAFNRYPIDNIEIIVNGRLLGGDELKAVKGGQLVPSATNIKAAQKNASLLEFGLPVRLENGLNRVEIVAANEACYGVETLEINNKGKAGTKPDLWILSIGVNDYKNLPKTRKDEERGLTDLDNAAGDAKRIVAAFAGQQGKRFNKVNTLLVADGEKTAPTRANILDSMKFLKQVKPEDVAILFVAAHGITDNDVFYFLPSDIPIDAKGLHPDLSKAINIEAIMSAVDIPGRKIVLIDTCQSGGVDNNRLIRTLKNRSTAIFTAAQQYELAQESEDYGGHFTYSIVEGLRNSNNPSGKLVDLGVFVTDTVKQLSRFGGRGKIRQSPSIIIPDGFANFVVAEYR